MRSFSSLRTPPFRLLAAICIITVPALSQVRGVYPLGMSATNSGVTPETGISYVNQFLFYSRNQVKGAEWRGPSHRSELGDDGHEQPGLGQQRENRLPWRSAVFHVSHHPDRQQLAHLGY